MNKKYIGVAVILGLLIAGVYSFFFPKTVGVGADLVAPIAGQTYTLSGSGMSSSDTSFTLSSLTITQNGHPIQDNEVSDVFYLTIEPGSRSRQEIISCTTIGFNTGGPVTISGCTRGLSPITPYTASTSLAFAHSGGSTVIFSDAPQLFNQAGFKDNDETITGSWLFPTPLANENAATKAYVDALVNGGTVSNDRLVVAGTAGETMATGTLIYFNGTTQRWNKVNAASSTTYNDKFIGLAQGAGTDGVAISGGILLKGRDVTQTGMTPGALYYAATGTATGTITTDASAQTVGIAVSATVLYFDPVWIDVPHENADNTFTGSNTFTGTVTINGFNPTSIGNGIFVASTTGTSTFSVPTGVKQIKVQLCGGGGNGGNGSDEAGGGGGGGAGGYTMGYIDVSATSSITFFVGSSTEETRFGSGSFVFLRATGGSNGAVSSSGGKGGDGGVGSLGQLNLIGSSGIAGGGTTANRGPGGTGGSSFFGGAGTGANAANGGGSVTSGATCSGGGGNSDTGLGASGGVGLIVIEW